MFVVILFSAILLSFCNFNEFREGSSIIDSEVSQHFAVYDDTGFGQTIDETAVAEAVCTGSCVDTSDPQFTEFAFLGTTVTTSVVERFHDAFVSFFEETAAGTAIAFSHF